MLGCEAQAVSVALDTPPHLTLFVRGLPVPQGSVSAFVIGGKARVVHKKNSELRAWREQIAREARKALGLDAQPCECAVRLSLTFFMQRPPSHFTSSGALRKGVRVYPQGKPDLDKLLRGVLDGLTGVLYGDDAQVCSVEAVKLYASEPGLELKAWSLEP